MDVPVRITIINALRGRGQPILPSTVLEYLESSLNFAVLSPEELQSAKKSVSRFCSEFHDKFKSSRISSHLDRLLTRHSTWLHGKILLPESLLRKTNYSGGRPQKQFDLCCDRAKRLKTDDLAARPKNELAYALSRVMKNEDRPAVAQLISNASSVSNGEAASMIKKLEEKPVTKISGDKALALLVDGKMGKNDYNRVRFCTKSAGAEVYPSYNEVQRSKKKCYPPTDKILITDYSGEVELQALVDHTASRIFEVQQEVLERYPDAKNFNMKHKCGMDGSSDHAQFKKTADENFSDSHMFLITLVPLSVTAVLDTEGKQTEITIWFNNHASSTRLTRPVKFVFQKENEELVLRELNSLNHQIKNLQPTEMIGERFVEHQIFLTMLDGKIVNFLTGTKSSQSCNICGLKPSQMNDKEAVELSPVNKESLQYGIPILHSKIRLFECIKNIGYRADFSEYQVRKGSFNELVFLGKKTITQRRFLQEMGLHVDKPRSGGVGNSNDGNTARRAFENPSLFSNITGVSEELITRLGVILEVLSSSYAINVLAFQAYCDETWDLYVRLYPWYCMPPSLHKILVHGSAIVEAAPLPIGCFSEEAQESRNKDLRNLRMDHTRKTSWKDCHQDLMNGLLISSDAVISSLRDPPTKGKRSFSAAAMNLLTTP